MKTKIVLSFLAGLFVSGAASANVIDCQISGIFDSVRVVESMPYLWIMGGPHRGRYVMPAGKWEVVGDIGMWNGYTKTRYHFYGAGADGKKRSVVLTAFDPFVRSNPRSGYGDLSIAVGKEWADFPLNCLISN